MFFAFSVWFFGFLIEIRILKLIVSKLYLKKSTLTKFGTVVLVFFFVLLLVLPKNSFFPLISVVVLHVVTLIASKILHFLMEKKFEKEIHLFIDLVFLNMKTGNSFRSSFIYAIAQSDPFYKKKWHEIYEVVTFIQQFSKKSSKTIEFVISELCNIDKQKDNSSKRLSVLRKTLKLQNEFRHRSGQILHQTRFQALLMAGMYLALLVFSINQFGFYENRKIMLSSIGLFSVGIAMVLLTGRSHKWKL